MRVVVAVAVVVLLPRTVLLNRPTAWRQANDLARATQRSPTSRMVYPHLQEARAMTEREGEKIQRQEEVGWSMGTDRRSDHGRAVLTHLDSREDWGKFSPRLAFGGTTTTKRHPR